MSASEKMALSVLIAARNEEVNIVECIRSVQWADQVYVLDSQSS
ncbi:MAG: glycosyltransferase involved in cell wall biosynthesis, partial [Kiritimatiellia bacterium]